MLSWIDRCDGDNKQHKNKNYESYPLGAVLVSTWGPTCILQDLPGTSCTYLVNSLTIPHNHKYL